MFCRHRLALVVTVAVVGAAWARGQVPLAFTSVDVNIGDGHRLLVIADVVGSSADDVITYDSPWNRLRIIDHAGGGATTFIFAPHVIGLIAHDLDLDGDGDLALVSGIGLQSPGTVKELLNSDGV